MCETAADFSPPVAFEGGGASLTLLGQPGMPSIFLRFGHHVRVCCLLPSRVSPYSFVPAYDQFLLMTLVFLCLVGILEVFVDSPRDVEARQSRASDP